MKPLFPGKRFSFFRLFVALLCVTLIVGGTWMWLTFTRTAAKKMPAPWFGGYVDVTATPQYEFESNVGTVYQNEILSFITGDGCKPSWGGYYSLDSAAHDLDLDSRVAQVYKTGRTITVSFGGQSGKELASTCADVDALANAYQQVIDRYHITSIDFDIEESNLDGYSDAATRRAQAVAKLVEHAKEKNEDLAVSLTIPADRHGMTKPGMETISAFFDSGVSLASVNLMTMDFNVPSTTEDQSSLIKESLNAAHAQYKTMLYQRGKLFSDHQIWELMGATVLIGQNDTKNEFFTLDDAQHVNSFALETSLGRLSMWSLNRDKQCGENYTNTNTIKTFCSGAKQTDGEYATMLGSGLTGTPGSIVDFDISKMDSSKSSTQSYPTWSAGTQYRRGDKVIWNGNIYEALGPSENEQPDSAENGVDAQWRIIGPVL
ncbi:chitinase [Bifidobacterium sp.]|uniref:chitinase n=1 Tax=Bifidobacterium sp. TaxID=41200 RepID=UPI003D7E4240